MSQADSSADVMQKIVSLCKRRGFVFQSSDIYGGLRSAYDYGPLGVELKRNLMNEWWTAMVHAREDIVGLDASIMMHPKVWHASGHLAGFSDPLVDCLVCKERFRADQAPRAEAGDELTLSYEDKGRAKVALSWLEENHPELDVARSGKTISGVKAGELDLNAVNCWIGELLDEHRGALGARVARLARGRGRGPGDPRM